MSAEAPRLLPLLALLLVACGGTPRGHVANAAPTAAAGGAAPESAWGRVLEAHVSDGLVDYAALAAAPADLDAALEALAQADLNSASRAEQVAFWVNAYNLVVIARVVDVYPISGTDPSYPSNSVLQLKGFFDAATTLIAGRELTLNALEKTVLLGELDEPLSHFALVCAAGSCPPLRNEPFTAAGLESQLAEQVALYLGDPRRNQLEGGPRTVRLSKLFQWYGGDFVRYADADAPQLEDGKGLAGVLALARRHLDGEVKLHLSRPDLRIEFMDYDWGLNDRAHPPANLR